MNRQQFLLTKLAEEASEVAQMALKTQQFGMDEIKPGQNETNRERLYGEIQDMMAMVYMLNKEFNFGCVQDDEWIRRKCEKVNLYYFYSMELGQVDDDKKAY